MLSFNHDLYVPTYRVSGGSVFLAWEHVDVRQCERTTYVMLFSICPLVGWRSCFRDSLRAYGIKTNQHSNRWAEGKKLLTRRNTLPRVLSSVPWLSKHAAQEVLVQQSRKYAPNTNITKQVDHLRQEVMLMDPSHPMATHPAIEKSHAA